MSQEPAQRHTEASEYERVFVILLHRNTTIQIGTFGGAGRLAEAREPAGASYSKVAEKHGMLLRLKAWSKARSKTVGLLLRFTLIQSSEPRPTPPPQLQPKTQPRLRQQPQPTAPATAGHGHKFPKLKYTSPVGPPCPKSWPGATLKLRNMSAFL